MSNVQIDPQEKFFWIATDQGWQKRAGFTAIMNGLKISLFSKNEYGFSIDLVISLERSGVKFLEIPLSIYECFVSETKELTLALYQEKLEDISVEISPELMRKIMDEEKKEYKRYVIKYGFRPPDEIITDLDIEIANRGDFIDGKGGNVG